MLVKRLCLGDVCYGYMWTLFMYGIFFFFKQKTAYEMRISDWSSDVCSSDLHRPQRDTALPRQIGAHRRMAMKVYIGIERTRHLGTHRIGDFGKIGRASCRERVCQYV